MNETFWIIGEIIVGIVLLGLGSAVVTAVMAPFLDKRTKQPAAADILAERYARGELSRAQYVQMHEDLGIDADTGEVVSAGRGMPGSGAA